MAKAINWINEKEAAELLRRKPRTIRKKVVAGIMPISYRTIEGRNYQYSENDLNKWMEQRTIYR